MNNVKKMSFVRLFFVKGYVMNYVLYSEINDKIILKTLSI